MSDYKIKEVDGSDDDIAEAIHEMDSLCFSPSDAPIKLDVGRWWIAYFGHEPAAYAAIQPSTHEKHFDYFSRVGVLSAHRGQGLQRRLMRAFEKASWRQGSRGIITDCTADNISSANNIRSAGYGIFWPVIPWALPNAIYWRKCFT